MEMNRMSDYYRVYPVHQIKAIDPSGMNINPDRRQGSRRERQKGFSFTEKAEDHEKAALENAHVRRGEREVREEVTPLMLWMVMSGKNRILRG